MGAAAGEGAQWWAVTKIVSIQSHVAYGHVGNSAAQFPLMRMGCDVVPVLTVHFAASTIYGPPRGPLLSPDQVGAVVDGMNDLGFLGDVDAVLSGFQGAPAMGARILESVRTIKASSPAAIYCCDPVMGDVGRGFFVMPGIPEFIRDQVIGEADIVTPNHFELDYLTGRQTRTLAQIVDAAHALRDRGPDVVVVTSAVAEDAPADRIHMVAVDGQGAWLVSTPKLDRLFTGSGDVTSAVYLHHHLRSGVAEALGRTADIVYGLLARTAELGTQELALVAAQDEFVDPSHRFEVERLA